MNLSVILGVLVAVLSVTNWISIERLQNAQELNDIYETKIATQKRDAGMLFAAEAAKVRQLQSALKIAADTLEKAYAANKIELGKAAEALAVAKRQHGGRLRDPNADRCGGSGGSAPGPAQPPAGGGEGDKAETGGLLSVQLSDLLDRVLREADDINVAYAACRADALSSRGSPLEPADL